MIPSLVAAEIRESLVDFLATTFALADSEVSERLADHLTDPSTGIFRGPYLRLRTPFRPVGDTWASPLGWLPPDFRPYVHQALAFERLSSAGDRTPQPTLVTTGTGSGKTECFLLPVLDHCARAALTGQGGIKAILLYPMNALATDQAGRLAAMIADHPHLAGIRAGVYLGDNGGNGEMGADHLIDDRNALRASPPDILLTNYKMLDFLLLRSEDDSLWARNDPSTLQYLVLDEFHTYDGAQGTDVAMLLRRLGARLAMATPEHPLGGAAAVGTSATAAGDPRSQADLLGFASKVFGCTFSEESIIGENRLTVDEACKEIDRELPTPLVGDVVSLPIEDHDALVAAFCTRPAGATDPPEVPADPITLGDSLRAHPLTRAILAETADGLATISAIAESLSVTIPEWNNEHPSDIAEALGRFLSLISLARREVGDRLAPLFGVDVQLWVREVSRLLRSVGDTPGFRWLDEPPAASLDDDGDDRDNDDGPHESSPRLDRPLLELPAVYCRACGQSGWMSLTTELGDVLSDNATKIYRGAIERARTVRILLTAPPGEPTARHFDPGSRRLLDSASDHTIAVNATPDEDSARHQTCPACGERDSVRFVGIAVASLASVAINTIFASPHVQQEERKVLAFTDSVQDAAHRAAFIAGRTHRFNARSLISTALQELDSPTTAADLADHLLAGATSAADRYVLVPPDLLRDLRRDRSLHSLWSDEPDPAAMEVLRRRVAFEVDLEFGLRARVGRTLEQSLAAVAWAELGNDAADLTAEAIRDILDEPPESAISGIDGYLLGIGERLRDAGAVHNPLLEPYVTSGGEQYRIWGGRPRGLPPFTTGQSRPTFATTVTGRSTFDRLGVVGNNPTWYLDWAMRSLGLSESAARDVNLRIFSTLAGVADAITAFRTDGGSAVYGLARTAIVCTDIDDDAVSHSFVRCDRCRSGRTIPAAFAARWVDSPCQRYRCLGRYRPDRPIDPGFYRRFYRKGVLRRVVSAEHTSLLSREDREALETAFKSGTSPDTPNVLAATPTLEMGIDIGDLSTVMLTSVPRTTASYLQRAGRAGRATGNALVTTFVRSDNHGRYYLAEPEAMLAGAIRAPHCFLDATETLQRHYVAYLVDRVADATITAEEVPHAISSLISRAWKPDGLFTSITDASVTGSHVEDFLVLFGSGGSSAGAVSEVAAEELRRFATDGIAAWLRDATTTWEAARSQLTDRSRRLSEALTAARARDDDPDEIQSLSGQLAAILKLIQHRNGTYWIQGLEALGVLPNYTLLDEGVTLTATVWHRDENDEPHGETFEYRRGGSIAIREFAPGNSFYAAGYRHFIDSVEIGPPNQPLTEVWRLCPQCDFATPEVEGQPVGPCKRCKSPTIADIGARHTVLRFHAARASAPEERARVHDETDERTRERYDIATLVDPDPASVIGAWLFEDRVFGAEFCRRTHLRTFNLGLTDKPGATIAIGGETRHVARFTVCNHCGAVRDVRDDRRGERPDRLHQGWCRAKSGPRERWEPLVLMHELTTEAIRFIVPVSMYEVDERLATLKGALLLGLRARLGGTLDHLAVTVATSPNPEGQGRRRFVVIYDRVPGGTGYLAPLVEPDEVREILRAARRLLAACPCRDESRPACHRCLLGVIDRSEYDLVSRSLANEMLDGLLDDWSTPSRPATIGDADISLVEESELERRFKVALAEWAAVFSARTPNAEVTFAKVPGQDGRDAFELAIRFDGDVVRYRINEEVEAETTPRTRVDFVFTRLDTTGPPIAVYLDGFQFHASAENLRIAADARKRHALRSMGKLVWNLTWTDVESFHAAVTATVPREAPDRILLSPTALAGARDRIASWMAAGVATRHIEVAHLNPMALLLDHLASPDPALWSRLAEAAVIGAAAAASMTPLSPSDVDPALDAALRGQPLPPIVPPPSTDPDTPFALGGRYVGPDGFALSLFAHIESPERAAWTAIAALPDDPASVAEPAHRARWAEWLAWSNLLQFLGLPHEPTAAVICGASQADDGDYPVLDLRARAATADTFEPDAAGPGQPAAAGVSWPSVDISNDDIEELDLICESVRPVVEAVLRSGGTGVVAGCEIDGVPIEAAWPDRRVGISTGDHEAPAGWDVRPVSGWDLDELRAAAGAEAQPPTDGGQ